MALTPAVRAAVAVLRRRIDDLLPAFLLLPAVGAVARVAGLAGVAIAYVHLEVTGRLDRFRTELAAMDLEQPNPNADPEAIAEWIEAIVPLFERLVTPTVVAVLAVSGLVAAVLFVVVSAVATAAQLAACRATLQDARGTTAAIRGAGRHWLSLLGLFVGEFAVWVGATALAVVAITAAVAFSPIVGGLVGLAVVPLWFAVVLTARLLFAFAPVAVVADDVGVAGGLRRAAGYARAAPGDAIGYGLVAVGVAVALGLTSALLPQAGGVVAAVAGFLVVIPLLSLTKTALYVGHVASVSPPTDPESSLPSQVAGGGRRGLGAVARFVQRSPGLQLLSAGLFVGGFALGWLAATPYDGVVVASIDARIAGQFPPTAAAFYAANNWTVAVGSALSGLALGVPAAVSMLFNGAFLGVYGRLEASPMELLAFVAPHGVLELPAIVVSGALGLSLGAAAWRTLRGRTSAGELADDLEAAFWVLIGIGVVLVVAGLVEGFVSPYYYRPFLST